MPPGGFGYAPSNIARSLITQRSQLIGVVVTETTTRNYPDVLFYLGQEIQESGNRMLVFTLPNDVDRSNAISDLLSYHVDGIISGATLPEDLLEACERHDVPVVLYNRVSRSPVASAVGCDHATAMHDLVSHLAKGGIARAVFVAGPRLAPVSEDRLRGAQAALAELDFRRPRSSIATTPTRAAVPSPIRSCPVPTGRTRSSAQTTAWRWASSMRAGTTSASTYRGRSPFQGSTTSRRRRGRLSNSLRSTSRCVR